MEMSIANGRRIKTKHSVVRVNKRQYRKGKATFYPSFNEHSNETLRVRINESETREFQVALNNLRNNHVMNWGIFDFQVQSSRWCIPFVRLIFIICSPIMSVFRSAVGIEESMNDASAVCIKRHSLYFDPEEVQKFGWPMPHLFLTRTSSSSGNIRHFTAEWARPQILGSKTGVYYSESLSGSCSVQDSGVFDESFDFLL